MCVRGRISPVLENRLEEGSDVRVYPLYTFIFYCVCVSPGISSTSSFRLLFFFAVPVVMAPIARKEGAYAREKYRKGRGDVHRY